MKRKLLTLTLAVLTVGLLGSCSKLNERIDNLEKRVDGIEATSIASVQQQIDGIKTSINDLKAADVAINGKIDDLKTAAETQQTLIDALKEADKALGQKDEELEGHIATLEGQVATIGGQIETLVNADKAINTRIDELKSYVDTELGKTKDWAEETFATLDQYEQTADDLAALSVTVTGISTTLSGVQTSITGLDTKIDGIDTALQGKITSAKTELEGKITSLKTELEGKITSAISASEASIKTWINELLGDYYTAALVDEKITGLNTAIEAAKGTAKYRIDSLATELTTLKDAVDTAKAAIRTEYKNAIDEAINKLDGEIRGALKDSILAVNGRVEALDTRVTNLENRVLAVEGNVNKLLAMIQSVSITPAYSDGSVEAVDGILTLKCIVRPAEALTGMQSLKDSLLIYADLVKVKTKATPAYMEIKVKEASKLDAAQGAITLKADISECLPKDDAKALTVALKIKNGISDFTTEFVPVYVAPAPVVPVTGVTLNKTELSLIAGKSETLVATVQPADATNKNVIWSSDNTAVATVGSTDGKVTAVAEGTATITAIVDGLFTATCAVTVIDPKPYVEIGGVKWATMNLGATTVAGSYETCAGDYYAWGVTEPYYGTLTRSGTSGTFSNWKTGKENGYSWQSYCGGSSFVEWSTPPYDNTKKILKAEYDAATAKLGTGWRMPTSAEFKALYDACINGSYDETKYASPAICGESTTFSKGIYWCANYDGVAGVLFCDGTNKVFFPAAGYGDTKLGNVGSYGYYWSSSLFTSNSMAYILSFNSNVVNSQGNFNRYFGLSVRPVKAEDAPAPTPTLPDGALAGEFSVSATKKVHFSKGNLYYDGSKFNFETNQYDVQDSWSTSHVGHFYWSKSASVAYAATYSESGTSGSDVFFTNAEAETAKTDFTVNGVTGKYRTLSTAEWQYLFSYDGSESGGQNYDNDTRRGKYKSGVTVCEKEKCLILVPDECLNGYSFDNTKTSYSVEEWATAEAAGLVCLPAAGYRERYFVCGVGGGDYWSSSAYYSNFVYSVNFNSNSVAPGYYEYRYSGFSVRLITESK